MFINCCKICGENVSPTPNHLKTKHGITMAEYREQTGSRAWGCAMLKPKATEYTKYMISKRGGMQT